MLLIRKSIDNLHKAKSETMLALKYYISSELDNVLIEDVIKERVKKASRPNIYKWKRIYALAKKEKNGV
jgi:hypothetical protein